MNASVQLQLNQRLHLWFETLTRQKHPFRCCSSSKHVQSPTMDQRVVSSKGDVAPIFSGLPVVSHSSPTPNVRRQVYQVSSSHIRLTHTRPGDNGSRVRCFALEALEFMHEQSMMHCDIKAVSFETARSAEAKQFSHRGRERDGEGRTHVGNKLGNTAVVTTNVCLHICWCRWNLNCSWFFSLR